MMHCDKAVVCHNGDAAFQHSTAGEGIDRNLQREATRGQQSNTTLIVSALGLMLSALAGGHYVRSKYSRASTALVAEGCGLLAAGTERYVGARGHARQLGITLGRTTHMQWGITPHRSL